MDLNELLVFAKVVRAGSFSGASRELDMPKSTVSRKVAELEERLGARLLHRTTRKLSLTDVGHAYYQHALRVVAELEEAELAVTRLQDSPRGLLRITAPLNFDHLGPIIASFLARFPEVQVDMVCADRIVDLIDEGFDVAIRAGRLNDSTMVARSLGHLRSFVVASPAYLERKGCPESLADLEKLDVLVFGAGPDRNHWKLSRDGRTVAVPVRARLIVNDFDLLRDAALAGSGIAMLPIYGCMEELRLGRLKRVLPDWSSPEVPVHALYPSTRHPTPKLRAFLDHLLESMTPPPWERGPLP